MNQLRIRDIKKRLAEITKLEESMSPSADKPKEKPKSAEKDKKPAEAKASDKDDDEEAKKTEKNNSDDEKDEKDGKTTNKDKNESDSEDESNSKASKTENKSDTESKARSVVSKSVKFERGNKEDDVQSKSEHEQENSKGEEQPAEMSPLVIEKNKLMKDLERYQNYGYVETHNEIMEYLEVHDPQKYRLRAKGVQVIPFFMKGKYSLINGTSSKVLSSLSSNDGRSDRDDLESKRMYKEKIVKGKLGKVAISKAKTRNAPMQKGDKIANTLSPTNMKNKLNANLLQQNKTKVSLKPKEEKVGRKITLESLQHMNLKDFNSNGYDEFRPKDIMNDNDILDDDSSVFDYFFPENKAKKVAKVKKTTSNKFVIKKAIIKDPKLMKIPEESIGYVNSDPDIKSKGKKTGVSNAGNLTSRVVQKDSPRKESTRRSAKRSGMTGRKTSKSGTKSKSKSRARNSRSKSQKKGMDQKSKMLNRAAQIDKQRKMDEKTALSKVLKMHDNQMKKGLNVLKKK